MKGRPLRFRNLPGRKYISGRDTFLRHRLVSQLAKKFNPTSILDVGGEGLLSLFMREVRVTTANTKSADIDYSGESLPVHDNSFDLVVSLDTIEHLPKTRRSAFIKDLYRVAKRGLIICAPFGTAEHVVYEKQLLESGLLSGESSVYLAEHVALGLPTPLEVSAMAGLFGAAIHYEGDFRKAKVTGNGPMRSAYLSLFFQTLCNMFDSLFGDMASHLKQSYGPYTNRFFLIAVK